MGMTDEEIICNWMEPKPVSNKICEDAWASVMAATLGGSLYPATPKGWWVWVCVYQHDDKPELMPRPIGLDRLWEAEERLTPAQCSHYTRELGMLPWLWHATAEQKIKALAVVIRGEAGNNP